MLDPPTITHKSHLPVGAGPLRCEVHPVRRDVLVIHDFTETEVRDFYLTTHWPTTEQYVACEQIHVLIN